MAYDFANGLKGTPGKGRRIRNSVKKALEEFRNASGRGFRNDSRRHPQDFGSTLSEQIVARINQPLKISDDLFVFCGNSQYRFNPKFPYERFNLLFGQGLLSGARGRRPGRVRSRRGLF